MKFFLNTRLLIFTSVALIVSGMVSCSKNSEDSVTGDEMFWTNKPLVSTNITVSIDSSLNGIITSYYNQVTPPPCGSSGCFTQSLTALPDGTHNYGATDGTHIWSGTFTITSSNNQHCNSIVLTY